MLRRHLPLQREGRLVPLCDRQNARANRLDPVLLTKAATGALEGLIADGVPYARAGVMLTDLSPAGAAPQLPMFATAHEEKHIGTLLGDTINRFGTGAIGLGIAGIAEPLDCGMKRQALSQRYTTEWNELPVVRAA